MMNVEYLMMNDEGIKNQFIICKFKDGGSKILHGTTTRNKRAGVNEQESFNIFPSI
jgi:hypothetical protein